MEMKDKMLSVPIQLDTWIKKVGKVIVSGIGDPLLRVGYDVEPGIPYFFLGDPFFPVRLQDTETYDKELLDKIMEFVLKQINSHAQAQLCGKRYELVEIEKLVEARAHRVKLITFRAKELSDAAENMDVETTIQAMVFAGGCCNVFRLLEWRFKPPLAT